MTELTKCKIPKVFISAEKADGRLMQHNLSGVLHFIVCGRQVNALYGMVAHQWPVCQQCRRAVGEDILSTFVEEKMLKDGVLKDCFFFCSARPQQ